MSDWYHIYPVNDKQPHNTESKDCHCDPKIDYVNFQVVHNAFDLRELDELIGNIVEEGGDEIIENEDEQ